jgi:hypothetical protein
MAGLAAVGTRPDLISILIECSEKFHQALTES